MGRARRLLPLLLGCCLAGAPSRPEEVPRIRAERSGFRATDDQAGTLDFLRSLAALSPALRVVPFGRSAEGRELSVVIVSDLPGLDAAAARRSGRPIVVFQSGIHGGEIDGKDASLMLLRSLALGEEPEVLERVVLLVVPIYNVDGHERVSPYHRPNQDGPVEGMGFRTTADGHDLNRDHVKLETPEARALLGLFNEWRPHLHVDNHVTNGSDHAWVLTHTWARAPQVAAPIDAWLAAHMPSVTAATRALGHENGPYVSLVRPDDPGAGIDSIVAEPRYATGYYPLRNRPSILVENHAYKPYRERVLANRDFLLALLREIAREPATLVEAVREAEERTVADGRPDAPPSSVTLRYRHADPATLRSPLYAWTRDTSVVTGKPLVRYRRGVTHDVELPWFHRLTPDLQVARPRGYLVLPGWPAIERPLRDHGLRVRVLASAVTRDVETLRLRESGERRPRYQGLTPLEVEVERRVERRELPAGTLWIPADQPDFEVAVQLLEPEAPDSLVAWGLLSIVLERKEWIDGSRLDDLARDQLRDPATRAAWKRALTDKAFAADPRARFDWWFRRTPYWDESVGLLPVLRLLTPPDFETAPG
jgi:hypothetical protein